MSLLEMKQIKKEFEGTTVIKDLSLSVEEGEVLAIIGHLDPGSLRCFAAQQCWKLSMTGKYYIRERRQCG